MKLASLNNNTRDGQLIIVSRDLQRYVAAPDIALTMQQAIDHWDAVSEKLKLTYEQLNSDISVGERLKIEDLLAPLPRAYQWLDGSVYLNHVELVRKSRGVEIPETLRQEPLMYQGVSDNLLSARAEICFPETYGIDFEAEVAVITKDIPMGSIKKQIEDKIILIGLVNDVSLRNIIPQELSKGFGFVQGKPASSFSPVFVTPDELGDAWKNFKLHLPLLTYLNDQLFGCPNAGQDMYFDYGDLLVHASKTRSLSAGTILGAGTVSNYDPKTGASCIAEVRVKEIIETGKATTPFLTAGDEVRIEMFDKHGKSIFGAIVNRCID